MSESRQPLLRALRAAHVRLGLAAVVAAGLVLTMVSLLTLRTYVEQNLQLVARSIAYSAEAATVFNDPVAARDADPGTLRREDRPLPLLEPGLADLVEDLAVVLAGRVVHEPCLRAAGSCTERTKAGRKLVPRSSFVGRPRG